ncbi:hypothetical protein [Bacillus toyonensis]|uniref:hypothetical protein n=1 Tax=Bacillus toyonensis TaxID=155322 RepID=UPI00124C367A|nr:hypothetical protein [Bacillus toyonensis]KAB2380201.1 hypothetical protein F8507_27335 [Bacillus toyonensis]
MNIEQRRQQDDFITNLIAKAREGGKESFLVGRTYDALTLNDNASTIRIDLDTYSNVSSLITCRLLGWSQQALRGKPVGQKVLIGYLGNFYAVIDIVIE